MAKLAQNKKHTFQRMHKRLVVIGGGAAGFFAAINAAKTFKKGEVLILEKTAKLLSKVKISGGGRCNVTHACFDPKELSTNYPRGEKELMGPLHTFFTADIIEWFEQRGVPLKAEEDGRMFPVSDSSQSIIDCFLEEAQKENIDIWTKAEVKKLNRKDDQFELLLQDDQLISADFVIMAIGGHPNKQHYKFLEDLGHKCVPPIPSLFTFNLPKHASNALMGTVQTARVWIEDSKFEEFGPVLFTHWGMSGPAILKLSAKAATFLHGCNYDFRFKVAWTEEASNLILSMRRDAPRQKLGQTKVDGFTRRFWNYLLERSGISPHLNWADLNRMQMDRLAEVLEKDSYRARGKTTFKEEFVTCGGVVLEEIDMKRMESKLIPNLYFCGEVVNVDAYTGGFNFQAAWTTAWLAAQDILSKTMVSQV